MATTVKEVLDNLSDEDREVLNIAFEHEVAQFIRIKNPAGDWYIGVYCDRIPNLTPHMEAGVWSVGAINEDNSIRTQKKSREGHSGQVRDSTLKS